MNQPDQVDVSTSRGVLPRRARLAVLLLLLVAVGGAKLGEHLYRWYAHAPERLLLEGMRERLIDEAVDLVEAQVLAEGLQGKVEREDRTIEAHRRQLEAYAQYSRSGRLPSHLFAAYRDDLQQFNQRVSARNAWAREYREALARQTYATERYTALADSIRALAEEIGDPFFRIPLPVEAAIERGVLAPPGPAAAARAAP